MKKLSRKKRAEDSLKKLGRDLAAAPDTPEATLRLANRAIALGLGPYTWTAKMVKSVCQLLIREAKRP